MKNSPLHGNDHLVVDPVAATFGVLRTVQDHLLVSDSQNAAFSADAEILIRAM